MSESNGFCGYIHDGYTRSGYIKESPRLHPEMRFKYRPLLTQDRALIDSKVKSVDDPKQSELYAAQAVYSRLVEWDLKDQDGKLVESTIENMLRVQPELLGRMYLMVMGIEGGDDDPNESEQDGESFDILGLSPESKEAAEAKNLEAGSGS